MLDGSTSTIQTQVCQLTRAIGPLGAHRLLAMNDPGEIDPGEIERGETADPGAGGPHLLSSILCKEVVIDRAGNPTGVRGMTSGAGVARPGKEGVAGPVRLEVKLLMVLVAGAGHGKPFVVELQPKSPLGNPLSRGKMPIEFGKDEHSIATIVVDYGINLEEHGVYWIDVWLTPVSNGSSEAEDSSESNGSSRLLTRMPLKYDFQ